MTRQIKFRATSKLPIMGEIMVHYFTLDEILRGKINFSYPEQYDFSQFTGLLDKNGKEIHEGDVIRYSKTKEIPTKGSKAKLEMAHHLWEVFFSERGQWRCRRIDGIVEPESALYPKNENHEVIGNIYENPDLIK